MAETADLDDLLNALRASGAAEREPVRFAYLTALARRAAAQPQPIRQLLGVRISAAASELVADAANRVMEPPSTSTRSPLTDLLTHIGQHAFDATEAPPSAQSQELKSVAHFRDEWFRLSSEQQLTQTLAQAPENAGPMNSQHLVLRSLQVMRDIAPDYLQGFMSYVDTLVTLAHVAPPKLASARSSGSEGLDGKRTRKRRGKNR